MDRKSPPFAKGAKDGAPSSSFGEWHSIENGRAQAGVPVPQAAWIQRGETQEGRASPATTMRKGLLALGSPELLEKVRVELEGGGEVVGEVGGVVAAGVEVEFVGDVAGSEDFIEGRGAGLETVVVLVAAIEIDF